jgi:AbrB family looped-hinge helix DNA binding protein
MFQIGRSDRAGYTTPFAVEKMLTLPYNVSMQRQITTVSTKGQFVIPSEMRAALGIKPGTRIAVTQDGTKITLEPVTNELVDKTRGMLKGKAHLTEKIRREWRREDRW